MTRKRKFVGMAAAMLLAGCQSSGGGYGPSKSSETGCLVGTVTGAVVGGLIGSTIGAGSGAVLATAAGIGLGSYAGNRLSCN